MDEVRQPWVTKFMSKICTGPNCWEWGGYTNQSGYGRATGPDGKKQYAHRLSYQLFIGPIPDKLTIDHLCRNPRCVNPRHLEAVTTRENIQRGSKAQQTHCKHGHSLHDAYTDKRSNGTTSRKCRQCHKQRVQKNRLKNAAKHKKQQT